MTQDVKKDTEAEDILTILESQGKITKEQTEEIRKEARAQNLSFFEVLLKNQIIDEETLIKSCAVLFGLSEIRLAHRSIPEEVLQYIKEEIARRYQLIPFEKKGPTLKIAVANPYRLPEIDRAVLQSLKQKRSLKVWFYLTTQNDLKEALGEYNKGKRKREKKPIEVQEERAEKPLSTKPEKERLLTILIDQGKLKPDQADRIAEIAKDQKKPLAQVLLEEGVREEDLQRARSRILDLPFIKIDPARIKKEAALRIPSDIAQKHQIGAFDQIGSRVLKIAAIDPQSRALGEIISFAKEKKGIDIKLFLVIKKDLEKIFNLYPDYQPPKPEKKIEVLKPKLKPVVEKKERPVIRPAEEKPKEKPAEEPTALEKMELKGRFGALLKKKVETKKELNEIIKKGSVPRIVAGVINFALFKRASDIHFQPAPKDTRLRYRIDGVLGDILEIPKSLHPAIVSRIKILSKLRIDERRIPQDGRFEVKFEDREVDLRVSTLPTSFDEKVVLRLLDKSKQDFKLATLGLKGSGYQRLVRNIERPFGMVIATGPTGSGKSTTLYAALSKINRPEINIVTLEDPVEYELDGVAQSQARPDIGFSFANGLRSVLRQDPDVIMVGEIRDKETAEMSIHAALTGHLLFSTLHTNDAAGAIPRLIDMGVEPFLISSAANAFMAQRLVRKICPKCKEKDKKFTKETEARLKKILERLPSEERKSLPPEKDWQLYQGKGCKDCYQGYKGRIGIFEVMSVSEEIKRLISKDVSSSVIRKKAIEQGMATMQQDGIIKVLKGLTTLEEVFRVTTENQEQF